AFVMAAARPRGAHTAAEDGAALVAAAVRAAVEARVPRRTVSAVADAVAAVVLWLRARAAPPTPLPAAGARGADAGRCGGAGVGGALKRQAARGAKDAGRGPSAQQAAGAADGGVGGLPLERVAAGGALGSDRDDYDFDEVMDNSFADALVGGAVEPAAAAAPRAPAAGGAAPRGGGGEARLRQRALAAGLDGSVEMLGFCSQAQMKDALRRKGIGLPRRRGPAALRRLLLLDTMQKELQ
ncbi:unnamed protein product, partial [Prorocentrum cordatum]